MSTWLSTVLESSSDAIVCCAIEGIVVGWNQAAEGLFGYAAPEIVGQNLRILSGPESMPEGPALLARLRAGESLSGLEMVRRRKDGAVIEVIADFHPVHDASGRVAFTFGILRPASANGVASRKLRYSDQRLGQALRSGRMGVWEWEIPTGCVYWSDETFELTGVDVGDFQGTCADFFDRVHPADRELMSTLVESAVRQGSGFEVDFRFVRADSTVRWFHNSVLLRCDEAGAPTRLVGIVQDVTERRSLVEALRESEERFRRAVMAAPFPVAIYAEGGEIVTLNDAFLANTGYARAELPTVDVWAGLAHGERSEEALARAASTFAADGVTRSVERQIRTASGAARVWDYSAATLGRMSDGRRMAIVIASDVTDRKAAEHALRESRERLRAALAVSQTGTFRRDFASGRLECDENLDRLLGLPRGQTLRSADAFFAMVHPDDRQGLIDLSAEVMRDGGDFGREYRVVWLDGTVRWLEVRGRVFRDESDRSRYMIGACIDVTRHKNIAQELSRAKEEAERASRAKDDFLATVSHELRTPLTAILGWARMINLPDVRPALVEEGMRSIERNARAQAQLVDDLLDISRIIAGNVEVRRCPIDLGVVVAAAAATARPAASAKQIEQTLDISPNVGLIDGDADRLQQVVGNLLSNAVKFTPTGGSIHIALSADNGAVVLRVTDTGAGIAPEFLPLMFERFRQEDASTTRRHSGLGLGLAIVRHFVELHDGAVYADSPGVGRGSTFTVRLPRRATAVAVEPIARGHAPPSPTSMVGALAGLRVLVVDDEADARALVTTVLESAGALVTAVASVASALGVVEGPRAAPFDVLMADIAMPDADGYDLLRSLREAEGRGRPRVPAVALTAQARVEDRIRALASGFASHVPKPVEPQELVAVVASVAGRAVK